MHAEPILADTIEGIQRILGADLDRICIERAVIGLVFTGVKLSIAVADACATPLHPIPEAVCCPSFAMAMRFPDKLRGRLAQDLRKETEAVSGIRRAVGVATMNALAEMCWDQCLTLDAALRAGVVLITGDTLVIDTLEDQLSLCRTEAYVVVVGPTVGLCPDAFLDLWSEGGSGYHFFGRSAEKVVLVRNAMSFKSNSA